MEHKGEIGRNMKILYSEEEIDIRVKELAEEISQGFWGKELVVIGVLKGAFIFMADLVRHFDMPCVIDFIGLSSYGSGTDSSGKIKITKDIEVDISGKHVLIVEDIIDTGGTLSFLMDRLRNRRPSSLKVCVFLDKKGRREVEFEVDYTGFLIDGGFVVGYGLDFNEMYRNLSEIRQERKGWHSCKIFKEDDKIF